MALTTRSITRGLLNHRCRVRRAVTSGNAASTGLVAATVGDPGFLRQVIGEGVLVDAAFLDPPYNVAIAGHANVKSQHREFAMASGEMTDQAFRAFLDQSLRACADVSRSGAVHFVCMDWRHVDDLAAVGRTVYDAFLNLCVWNKSNAGMGSLYRSKHELVFVYRVWK